MPRPARPWYRSAQDAWYVKHGGRAVLLAKGKGAKAEADAAWHRLLADAGRAAPGAPAPANLPTREVFDRYFRARLAAVARGEVEAATVEAHGRHLAGAGAHFGHVAAVAVRPRHVAAWLDSRPAWGPTKRYNAITSIKAAFRWAAGQGHIPANPIATLERPTPRRREAVPTAADSARILAAVPDRPFRDLLTALALTGARSGEVYGVTAAMFDPTAGTWTVPNKTRRRTGSATRTIYLVPELVDTCRRLAALHPTGPIFRNRAGRPWTRNAVALRFRRLRARLGMGAEACAGAIRHQYATDALEQGVPVATVAELLGHRDTTMLLRVYSRLAERTAHLREAAAQVRPAPDSRRK